MLLSTLRVGWWSVQLGVVDRVQQWREPDAVVVELESFNVALADGQTARLQLAVVTSEPEETLRREPVLNDIALTLAAELGRAGLLDHGDGPSARGQLLAQFQQQVPDLAIERVAFTELLIH